MDVSEAAPCKVSDDSPSPARFRWNREISSPTSSTWAAAVDYEESETEPVGSNDETMNLKDENIFVISEYPASQENDCKRQNRGGRLNSLS